MKNVFKILLILATTYCAQSLSMATIIKTLEKEKSISEEENNELSARTTELETKLEETIRNIQSNNDYDKKAQEILIQKEIDNTMKDIESVKAETNRRVKSRLEKLNEIIKEENRLENTKIKRLKEEEILNKMTLEREILEALLLEKQRLEISPLGVQTISHVSIEPNIEEITKKGLLEKHLKSQDGKKGN